MNKKSKVVFGLLFLSAVLLVVLFFGNRDGFSNKKSDKKKTPPSKKIPTIDEDKVEEQGCTGEGAIIGNIHFQCYEDPKTNKKTRYYNPSAGRCPATFQSTPDTYFNNIYYCAATK